MSDLKAVLDAALDCVVMMDHGSIVEAGTPEQLFAQPAEQRTMDFLGKILNA